MKAVIFLLVGIMLSVSKANGWFVVPDFCIVFCYGYAAGYTLYQMIAYFTVRKSINKINRRKF